MFILGDVLARSVYLLIAVVAFAIYQVHLVTRYKSGPQDQLLMTIVMNMMALICYWIYYKICTVSPGKVTSQNVQEYLKKYEKHFDGQRFKRGNKCKTCLLQKPARSKHCSTCGGCIAKCDHHCSWIGQCIGQKNYKYFIVFLLSHIVWAVFFTFLGLSTLLWHYNPPFSLISDSLVFIQYFFKKDALLSFLLIISSNSAVGLLILLCDHLWLIKRGQTTNERAKKRLQINYLTGEIRAANKLLRKFHSQIKEIDFQGGKLKKEEVLDYKQDCKRKKSDLERCEDRRRFYDKISLIFRS